MSSPSLLQTFNAARSYPTLSSKPPHIPHSTQSQSQSQYVEFDELPVDSPAASLLSHNAQQYSHHTAPLNNSSTFPFFPKVDDLSQQKIIARSLSVQPDMSSHCHFFTEDAQSHLTTITETMRRPFMFHAKFGSPSNWALDIFTLPHNAVRAECVDLYNILESIQARSNRVEFSELEEFYTWWTAFEIFVIEYFDFEADVLFSWIFSKLGEESEDIPRSGLTTTKLNSDLLLEGSLLARKEPLLESLRQINGTFELRRHVDACDVFHTILEDVNEFVPKLMEYFHLEERHLPPLVSHVHSPTAKDAITKKYVTYIKHGESPHMNIAILTRWMHKTTREKWVRSNVRGISRLFYARWEKRCNKEHGYIPFRFHRRLLRSVRNVAASRLRRRTEFGEEIEDMSFGSLASHTGSFKSLSLAVGSKGSSTPKSRRSKESARSKGKLR